jgi:hypothetical protein
MAFLESVEPLFKDESAVPKDTLKQMVTEDFKLNQLAGIPDGKLEISFNPEDGGDILIKVIDPHAASGYLVFQDESAYNDWLGKQLYEPTQDEIEEAASRG